MRAAVAMTTLLLALAGCDAEEPPSKKGGGAGEPGAKKTASPPELAKPGSAPGDDVDLDAAKQAFGCEAPKGVAAKRACAGLAAFETSEAVHSDPSDGPRTLLARLDCSTPPNDMINFLIAELSAEVRPADAPGRAAPGVVKLRFESWVTEDGKEASADRIMAELREGKALSALTPEEVELGGIPKNWADWQEKWGLFAAQDIHAVETGANSLRERSKTPAYWRAADRTLVRVAPPVRKVGWCVSQFFPVPQDEP